MRTLTQAALRGSCACDMPSSYNQAQMLYMQKVNILPDSIEYFLALEKQTDGSLQAGYRQSQNKLPAEPICFLKRHFIILLPGMAVFLCRFNGAWCN